MALKYGIFESEFAGLDTNNMPIYDRAVDEEFLEQYIGGLFTNGIGLFISNCFQVISELGNKITVNPGMAIINGKMAYDKSNYTVSLPASPTTYNRYDRVVLRRENLNRDFVIAFISGAENAAPVVPTLARTENTYELSLATILRSPSDVVTQAKITDDRLSTSLCGAIAPKFEPLAADDLFAQFTAVFNEWFNGTREVLTTDVAGNLLSLVNSIISNVGELSALTTTEKSNLVGAINELVTGIGSKTALTTTAKDNLVNAINEMNSNYTKQVGSGTTTGSANVYALTLSPAPTALVDNFCVAVKINVANTGASTLNVNGLGAKPIVNSYGTAVTAGDLVLNSVYTLRYNGTSFVIQGAGVTATEKTAWNGKIDKSVLTAAGDIIYAAGAATLAVLSKGTAYQQLMMNAGDTAPIWAASLQSLITAAGDIIYGSAANTPAKLAKGTDGQVLTLSSGLPAWIDVQTVPTITPSDTVILAADTERTNPTNQTSLVVKSFAVKNSGSYRIKCDIKSQYSGSSMAANYAIKVGGITIDSGSVGTTTTNSYATKTKDLTVHIPQNALIELSINNNNNIPYLKNAKICGTLTALTNAVTLD